MPNFLVRDVPEPVTEALKRRAGRSRRSLQQETLSILQVAASEPEEPSPAQIADAVRARLQASGRRFGDSASMLREDRER